MFSWEHVTIAIDSREQLPLDFGSMRTELVSLDLCDYSVVGLEHVVRIERKSLEDLLACVGRERERFDRQVERMAAYPTRAIIVEASWGQLELGQWRSKISPQAAIGSCLGWIARGVPVVMASNRERAAQIVARLCFLAARRRFREAESLMQHCNAGESAR